VGDVFASGRTVPWTFEERRSSRQFADRSPAPLSGARRRSFTYLAIAQSEAKQTQQAVATFEEALHEAQLDQDNDIANARFYFKLWRDGRNRQVCTKKRPISLANQSPSIRRTRRKACNYLGYMWADHNMNLDEAETMINRALEMEPNNASYLDSLGVGPVPEG